MKRTLSQDSSIDSNAKKQHIGDSDPQDIELVTFGKHKNKTFQQVLKSDPGYCEWFVHSSTRTITHITGAWNSLNHLEDLQDFSNILNPEWLHLNPSLNVLSSLDVCLSFSVHTLLTPFRDPSMPIRMF